MTEVIDHRRTISAAIRAQGGGVPTPPPPTLFPVTYRWSFFAVVAPEWFNTSASGESGGAAVIPWAPPMA